MSTAPKAALLAAIKTQMKDRDISRADLARGLGVDSASVSRLLGGETKDITIDRVAELEAALGVDEGLLFRAIGGACGSAREAIAADGDLDADVRAALLVIYDSTRERLHAQAAPSKAAPAATKRARK